MPPLRNSEGYLMEWQQWDDSIASWIAEQEKLTLTPAHWEVIRLVRSFYEEYHTSPPMRVLVKHIKQHLGPEKDSLYLHSLFPAGPALQATKIAGLPKPKKCL
jgi:tRNA 2-thiouridine synthesizing protein E